MKWWERKNSVLYPKEDINIVSRMKESILKYGFMKPTEVVHVKKDGTRFPMLVSAIVFWDDDDKNSI